MSYTVGQIIYLLSRKDVKVFPARVIEEIKRKTIDEEMTSYIVQLPDKDRTETLLEEISADVFTSIESAEKKMIENAHAQIKIFLSGAKEMSLIFEPFEQKVSQPQELEKDIQDKNKVKVDLGNGITGNIDLNQIPTNGG